MEKIKLYGSLILAMVSCFNLGAYTCSTFRFNEPVELHRWILTSMSGLFFLLNFLFEFNDQKNGKD